MTELMQAFVEQFGLLALYAAIILFISFSAHSLKHLFFVLSILSGVYITMFQAMNLRANFGAFDVTQFIPVSKDLGNMGMAIVFVYMLGFVAYGLKRTVVPREV